MVELVMAMAIFALSVTALVDLQIAVVRGNQGASQIAEATFIGQSFLGHLGTLSTSDNLLRPGVHPMSGDLWTINGTNATPVQLDLSACNVPGNFSGINALAAGSCPTGFGFEGGLGYTLHWAVIPKTISVGAQNAPYSIVNLIVYWGGTFNSGLVPNQVQLATVR